MHDAALKFNLKETTNNFFFFRVSMSRAIINAKKLFIVYIKSKSNQAPYTFFGNLA